ncbi:MAG: hypothetical protein GC165_03860 [Armatimonadetes bacterium]|nr:hypothetical protein [Armatimonadota bacterium]
MNEPTFDLDGWRDSSPAPYLAGDLLARVERDAKRRRAKLVVLSLAGSGLGVAALSTVFLFGSAPMTMAQVIAAEKKADSVTIVNHRIMGSPEKRSFTVTTKIAKGVCVNFYTLDDEKGPAQNFSYRDDKTVMGYVAAIHAGSIDVPSTRYQLQFRIPSLDDILKRFPPPTVERDFDWKGRKVTRFVCTKVTSNTDQRVELLADPQTNLPIRLLAMRDHGSWGDEYLYDYSKLDPADLKPEFPAGTEVFDNREVRKAMMTAVGQAGRGMPFIEVSPTEVVIPIPVAVAPKSRSVKFELNVKTGNGATKHFSATYTPYFGTLRIDKQSFAPFRWSGMQDDWSKVWKAGDKVSGSVKFGDKTLKFEKVPLIRCAGAVILNEPFMFTDGG